MTPALDAHAGEIVILSGSPGCGKTTMADALARLPGPTLKVHVHSDDFWGYIKHGLIAPWLPESDAQNRMIMDVAAGVAARYARSTYLVFLDGVIRPAMLPAYLAAGQPIHYIVLRVGVDEAVARCSARGGDSLADPHVVAALHAEFDDLGCHAAHCLDVSGLSRPATLAAIQRVIAAGTCRLAPERWE